jgi:hypothetical protein
MLIRSSRNGALLSYRSIAMLMQESFKGEGAFLSRLGV